jgi:uncharacterized protein (TIGR01777 family)
MRKRSAIGADEFNGADVVINLAGRNVNCRYNGANRREIMDSRVNSTRVVGEAIANSKNPPRFGCNPARQRSMHTVSTPLMMTSPVLSAVDEPDAPENWRFSIEVAKAWEREAEEANTPSTRKVLMRSAITLSPDHGGIFDVLLGLVRKGLGGTAGDGRQYISWIHDKDFVRSVYWLIDHSELSGPVNLAAPNPMTNKDFMRILRDTWGASIGLPAARWMLGLGAILMGTETELILKSRRVVPNAILDSGFPFPSRFGSRLLRTSAAAGASEASLAHQTEKFACIFHCFRYQSFGIYPDNLVHLVIKRRFYNDRFGWPASPFLRQHFSIITINVASYPGTAIGGSGTSSDGWSGTSGRSKCPAGLKSPDIRCSSG